MVPDSDIQRTVDVQALRFNGAFFDVPTFVAWSYTSSASYRSCWWFPSSDDPRVMSISEYREQRNRWSDLRYREWSEILRGSRKISYTTPAIRNMRAWNRPSLSFAAPAAQLGAQEEPRATTSSFLLVKGSFRPSRRKTRPRNATNTFAWPPEELLTTLPATWPRFWPGHRRGSNLLLEGLSHYQISLRDIYPWILSKC